MDTDFLLHRRADPNAASPGGINPLHGVLMLNQLQMPRWLLAHGADPNTKYEEKNPLALALEKQHPRLVEILRSFGGIK